MTSAPTFTPVPITIAGRAVKDAAGSVISYLETSGTSKRILDYDWAASERRSAFLGGNAPGRITRETISSANKLRGRLPYTQLDDWYQPQELTANWNSVTPSQTFVEADPKLCGGAYDDLIAIWFNFRPIQVLGHSAFGVGATQVNKVLHQVLPNLVPIFDSKLQKLYFRGPFRATSLAICEAVVHSRLALGCPSRFDDAFLWEPMRVDVAAISTSQFAEIRRQVATRPCANSIFLGGKRAQLWAAENLSDVRIVDMIAWQM